MPHLTQCCALKCKWDAIKYNLVSCILLVYLKYTLIGYFIGYSALCYCPAALLVMQMRAKCARFSAASSSQRLPTAAHVCASLCMCVCVSWPVATRSPRSVAFVTILNVSPGRQAKRGEACANCCYKCLAWHFSGAHARRRLTCVWATKFRRRSRRSTRRRAVWQLVSTIDTGARRWKGLTKRAKKTWPTNWTLMRSWVKRVEERLLSGEGRTEL